VPGRQNFATGRASLRLAVRNNGRPYRAFVYRSRVYSGLSTGVARQRKEIGSQFGPFLLSFGSTKNVLQLKNICRKAHNRKMSGPGSGAGRQKERNHSFGLLQR
jgi:hypothetical protein